MSTPTTRGAQSVNSILQTNHRERLFVPPLRWTDRHLQLLGCSFVAPPERDCRSIADALPDEPRGPIGALISSADVSQGINAARIFALGRFISAKYDGICLLLSYPGSALKTSRYDSLWFQFGQRSVSQLPCLTFTFRPKTSTKKCGDGSSTYPLPCLAFLTLTEIGKRRRKSLRPHLGLGQKDRPTFRIYQRNLQKLTPAEPLHDAYIAALLIALAQARRASQEEDDRWNGARGQSARAKTKVALILLDQDHATCLYLYSAAVSPDFCEKLDHPSEVYPAAPLEIHRQCVTFKPFATLRVRLVAAVLARVDDDEDRDSDDPRRVDAVETEPHAGEAASGARLPL